MTMVNTPILNFAGGELSPKMRGRFDLKLFSTGCEKMRNFIAETQGPARFRSGTVFVHQTRENRDAVLIPFQFNDVQSYLMEFTHERIRFHFDGGTVLEAAKNITGISKANPGVVTSVAHGYATDDEVYISGVVGMTQVNGLFFRITKITNDTFSLQNIYGNAIDTTGYTTYSSGGTTERIHTLTSPYQLSQLRELKFAQNADVMYITHKGHAPRQLTRTSPSTFTISTFSRTLDPFMGAGKYPGAVAFYEGRLVYGGTTDDPETVWFSRAVDTSGNPRYDDFTTGVDADHAVVFTLAPEASGKVDAIRFLAATNRFLNCGTFGGMKKMTGSTADAPITVDSINVKAVDSFGVENRTPVVSGDLILYVQRGGLIIRSFEFDWESEGYVSVDRNLLSDHVTESGVNQVTMQYGDPDVMWACTNDGRLIGLTFKTREDVSGWHQHELGGTDTKVLSVGVMPRVSNHDQIWMVVERTIDGRTVRYIEYMSDNYNYVDLDDFYTADVNQAADQDRWQNAIYEQQKRYIHLDSALTYNGADRATTTVTPAATTGESVTFTAGAGVFSAADVGNQIWGKYVNGVGGGRAEIISYTNSTHVVCRITKAFRSTSAIAAGNWLITAGSISGLDHLEGETVGVVTDGAVHVQKVVADGRIELDYQAGVIHIGIPYRGYIKSMNLETDAGNGPTQSKKRCVKKVDIRFLNTLGVRFGTDFYRMEELHFRDAISKMNRPSTPFSGFKEVRYSDQFGTNDRLSKHLIVEQTQPLPCTVQMLDVFTEVTEE